MRVPPLTVKPLTRFGAGVDDPERRAVGREPGVLGARAGALNGVLPISVSEPSAAIE